MQMSHCVIAEQQYRQSNFNERNFDDIRFMSIFLLIQYFAVQFQNSICKNTKFASLF